MAGSENIAVKAAAGLYLGYHEALLLRVAETSAARKEIEARSMKAKPVAA